MPWGVAQGRQQQGGREGRQWHQQRRFRVRVQQGCRAMLGWGMAYSQVVHSSSRGKEGLHLQGLLRGKAASHLDSKGEAVGHHNRGAPAVALLVFTEGPVEAMPKGQLLFGIMCCSAS